MATWTNIANTAVDADSPGDEALFTALRDNPTAQAEGASGAPKQERQSFDSDIHAKFLLRDSGAISAVSWETLTPSATELGLIDGVRAEFVLASNSALSTEDLNIQFHDGTSWVAANYGSSEAGAVSTVGQMIVNESMANASGFLVRGKVEIMYARDAGRETCWLMEWYKTSGLGTSSSGRSFGFQDTAAAHEQFRIGFTAGTIATGYIKWFGV